MHQVLCFRQQNYSKRILNRLLQAQKMSVINHVYGRYKANLPSQIQKSKNDDQHGAVCLMSILKQIYYPGKMIYFNLISAFDDIYEIATFQYELLTFNSYFLLVTVYSYCLLFTGHYLFFTSNYLLVTSYLLLVTNYYSLVPSYSLLVISYFLLIIYHLLVTFSKLLVISY